MATGLKGEDMQLATTGMTVNDLLGVRRVPLRPGDAVRRARRLLVHSLGYAALAAALVGDGLAVLAGSTRPELIGLCLLAQLPVLTVVVLSCCSRSRTFGTPLANMVELGSRAERAEVALAREHDRVHELRATLAGVSASHRVLHDERARLEPQRRRRLQRMHDAELDRLGRLLSDRVEPQGGVDVDAVIAPLAEASAVLGCAVTWSRTGCWVRGRPDAVTEALHVLIVNAARHGSGRDVTVTVTRRDGEVDLSVSDHGPGVAPELLPRIFGRAARGPGSSGSGLGLSIAQRRAEEMGGRLRLAPHVPGEPGATFVLTLLAHEGERACLAASS